MGRELKPLGRPGAKPGEPQLAKRTTIEQKLARGTRKTSGCWEWIGKRNRKGYGVIRHLGKWRSTHRIAWELANGPIAGRDLCVCHRCDNPPCVKIDHLFLGTRGDNNRDRERKGRSVRAAKVTASQVVAIRMSHGRGVRTTDIANGYGISPSNVLMIVRRKTWTHVT